MSKNKNRSDDILKGIKVGAVNASVERAIQPVADIFYKTAIDSLGSDHPLVQTIAASGSKAFSYLLFAEALELGGSLLEGKVSDAGSKGELLAQLARKKAGEEMGEEAIKIILSSLPDLFSMFSEFNTQELEAALEGSNIESSLPELESGSSEDKVKQQGELQSVAQELLK